MYFITDMDVYENIPFSLNEIYDIKIFKTNGWISRNPLIHINVDFAVTY